MDFSCKAKGLVKYLKLSTQFSGFNPDCSATCCIIPLESSYFVFSKPVCPPLMNQFLPLSCVLFHWLLRAFLWEETTILPPFKHFWQPKSSAQGGTESPLAGRMKIRNITSGAQRVKCRITLPLPNWSKKGKHRKLQLRRMRREVSQPPAQLQHGTVFLFSCTEIQTTREYKEKASLTGLCTS